MVTKYNLSQVSHLSHFVVIVNITKRREIIGCIDSSPENVDSRFIHSPHKIISMVCDFPYKIIEKCFKHHLNGNKTKRVVDISYELEFDHKKKLGVYG